MLVEALVVYGGFWCVVHPAVVQADHWDTLHGLMGLDARQVLETGDAGTLLKWVQSDDEHKVRAALHKTMSLRAKYPELTEVLDRSFFGTVLTIRQDGERALARPEAVLTPAEVQRIRRWGVEQDTRP